MKAENNPKSLASIVTGLLEKSFKWGGTGEGGYDCIGLTCEVQRRLGKNLSEKANAYPSVDHEEYRYMHFNDKPQLHKRLMSFYAEMGEEINPNYKLAGDILVLSIGDGASFSGIYLGNGNVLTSFRDHEGGNGKKEIKGGVMVLALKPFHKIVMVRRLSSGG